MSDMELMLWLIVIEICCTTLGWMLHKLRVYRVIDKQMGLIYDKGYNTGYAIGIDDGRADAQAQLLEVKAARNGSK